MTTAVAAPMVEAVGLCRDFPSGNGTVHALRGVDLRVERGEILAVRGRSGSGKTTLLNLIGGLDRPTSGTVAVDGRDVSGASDRDQSELRRTTVAYIFQTFGLIPILSAAENVEIPLRLLAADPVERDRRVHELLGLVGLSVRANHRPAELSGGEQQRVSVARALVARPRLVIADEPTASLDHATGDAVMRLMVEMNEREGATLIFSTHDESVARHAGRIVRMLDGRIVADGRAA